MKKPPFYSAKPGGSPFKPRSSSLGKKVLDAAQGTAPSANQGWDPVAAWYDKLVGEAGSDYHRNVILPAALRMMGVQAGESVLDVCCGQGVLARSLVTAGASRYLGIDASPRLIEAAQSRHGGLKGISFRTADACEPGTWADGSHDAAACLMAVHDVPNLSGLMESMARALKPGGRAVWVMMHPCFRIPQKTHWGWDPDQKVQFRRLDAYGHAAEIPIITHPGRDSGERTVFHHRPLADLLTAIGHAGLSLTDCEELYSHRRSQGSGPFTKAEHRAAEEFPLFLALRAVAVRCHTQ